jgi:DNA-binding transcriptional ArsR family regulator
MTNASTLQRMAAVAEPTRFRIVELLAAGPRPVGRIVEQLGVGQPQVSRHLRILTTAGVVAATPRAQQRIYRVRPEPFEELGDWAQSVASWAERMDRFAAAVQEQGNGGSA